MPLVSRSTVRASYEGGVDAVESIAADLSVDDWARPACGAWSAADTVRHMLSVAGWYHGWLDRAVAGDPGIPFPLDEMDERTARGLDAVGPMRPDDAVEAFVERARRYLARLDDEAWDLPYGYPRGVVTAGLHAGIAAVEWHVHAWDLSTVTERRHTPDDAAGLLLGAAACNAAAAGRVTGRLLRTLAPLAARREPWPDLLRRTGRDGGATGPSRHG